MTSAGPAPSWCAPPAAAEPMTAKIPAPTIAPMPSAISWIGPSARFIWCSASSRRRRGSGRATWSGRAGWLMRTRAEDSRRAAGAASRSRDPSAPATRRGSRSGPARRRAARPGRGAGPASPAAARPLVVLAQRVADVEGLGRPARRGARRSRRKISGSGLPVSSIAETRIASETAARAPRSASRPGRCESQLETMASGSPLRRQARRASGRRRRRPPRTPGRGSARPAARRPPRRRGRRRAGARTPAEEVAPELRLAA